MKDHHLQLNLAKTELLVVPSNPSFHHNFIIQLGTSTITPSKTARNLGVMIEDQLTFSDHIAKSAQSCRFALFNIEKTRPFLLEHASQLLVQARIKSLFYSNKLYAHFYKLCACWCFHPAFVFNAIFQNVHRNRWMET